MNTDSKPAVINPPKPDARLAGPGPLKENPYYIVAKSPHAEETTHVLKQGDTFAVLNRYGDVDREGLGEKGIYHEGTRHLSYFFLLLGDDQPLYLSSTVKEDNDLLTIDLTNPDIHREEKLIVPRSALHIFRSKFLWQGTCYERIGVRNYSLGSVQATLGIRFDADFADIFEVRGTRRKARGRYLEPTTTADTVVLAYEGLDGINRRTVLRFTPKPSFIDRDRVIFELTLPAYGELSIEVTACFESGPHSLRPNTYETALLAGRRTVQTA
jgi:glycogen debranching enzyme